MSKKVFFCRFNQESNSFNPVLTGFEDFNIVADPKAVMTENGKAGITVNGIYKTFTNAGYDLIPGLFMGVGSGSHVKHEVVEYFIQNTLSALSQLKDLDAICISMHGATMSDTSDDVCGDILESIRNAVGEKVIISVSLTLRILITT